ncbi:RIMS-binding protein 2 [Nilaparvata lugens]|uniref:RIMS-binding protein 2 n=1 Tax=Nilaparvata lugens TaxID=108931 RepID=UPI00193CC639|nr:RIMS-binding protein 2 [Nilaparvata lugens]
MIPESCKWIKGNGDILRLGTKDKVEFKIRCPGSSSELEDQLVRVLEKNTELTIQNTDLQKQVQHLQNVKAESGPLKADKLESILKQMRETADVRKELEREHSEAVNQLKEKQIEIQRKQGSAAEKTKAYENIETLQSKIRELEKKTELQNVRHEELMLEMAAIKRSQNKSNTSGMSNNCWKKTGLHQEIQTSPDSAPSTPDVNCVDRGTPISSNPIEGFLDHQRISPSVKIRHQNTGARPHAPAGNFISYIDSSLQTLSLPLDSQYFLLENASQMWSASTALPLWIAAPSHEASTPLRMCLAGVAGLQPADGSMAGGLCSSSGGSSSGSAGGHPPFLHQPTTTNITTEIDRIMAKIDQDNRILAELDKTRSTIAGGAGLTSRLGDASVPPNYMVTSAPVGLPMMSSLATQQMPLLQHHAVGPSAPLQAYQLTAKDLQPQVLNPLTGQYQFLINSGAVTQPLLPTQPLVVPQHHGRLMPQIPAIVTSQFELDSKLQITKNHKFKLCVKFRIPEYYWPLNFVFFRYSYDPYQQSPNECPEAELAISAGDYLLVWGIMDEDGFFDGELLDGRRGLVPSNFIQKLVGDDLLEFHQAVIQGLRDCDDSASTNIPQDLDYHHANADDYTKQSSQQYETVDYLEDDEEEVSNTGEGPDVFFSLLVPAPKQLTLERQLNKSILIGWNPPDLSCSSPIDCYHVYVDGVLKVTVKTTERTRALVEGVDSTRPHRISVRSVTANRRTSRDAACTMVIGKDVQLGPSQVKASRVTATSAVISWLPSNSNYQHTVCVNNVELRTVKPGVYRHTITGLAPNTVYRVTVRAKNIRAPNFNEKTTIPVERYSCHIDFRTLPKALSIVELEDTGCKGLPEPPVDIQVEPGPQDGTLLVTWQPASSPANPALVTGYAVYADGKKVTDVDSPTGDHALIDINKLLSLNPKHVTVRTKSRDNQSSDSLPTPIPSNVLKGKHSSSNKEEDRRMRYGSFVPSHMRSSHHQRTGQVIIETEENLSDKEIYPSNHMSIPAIEITKDTGSEGNFSEEDYMESSRGGPRGYDHGPSYDSQHRSSRHHGQRHPSQPHHGHSRSMNRRDERDYGMSDRGEMRNRHLDKAGYRGGRGGQPNPSQNAREKRPRWFAALFDYDPTTMSPNPDACDEELPFSEGDSIKVYGDKDADGFYWGECRGRRGYVPNNMVVEVQAEGAAPHGGSSSRNRDRWGDIYANMPVKKMIALYDYDPQELSPNVDAEQVELSFSTGNIIYVYGEMDDDGFYMGELEGVRGLVPSNFLTEAPPDYPNQGQGQSQGQTSQGQTSQGRRGQGPGARGPPPPPRDVMPPQRDRRKDACPVPTQVDLREVGRRERELEQEREKEREMERESRVPSLMRKYVVPPAPQPGIDKINVTQQQQQQNQPAADSSQPGANLMQKLSEMTTGVTGGDNSVDHILSKGKELIFMKFGLGK